jgi:hypothetical protein
LFKYFPHAVPICIGSTEGYAGLYTNQQCNQLLEIEIGRHELQHCQGTEKLVEPAGRFQDIARMDIENSAKRPESPVVRWQVFPDLDTLCFYSDIGIQKGGKFGRKPVVNLVVDQIMEYRREGNKMIGTIDETEDMFKGMELPGPPGHDGMDQYCQVFYALAVATLPETPGDIHEYRYQAVKHSLFHHDSNFFCLHEK